MAKKRGKGRSSEKDVKPKRKNPPTRAPEPTGEAPLDEVDQRQALPFPVVALGASAGGVEALTQLLRALPADIGMAFVIVQHLDPTHSSFLSDILSRATSIPIGQVEDQMRVEPNRIYVIPPGTTMEITRGVQRLSPRTEKRGQSRPIDHFLRSLADDQGYKSVGVILSGTATDGTLGLTAIKAEGGITFAQDDTAQHTGMPRNAIAEGCVDFVLPPDEIAKELARIARHPLVGPAAESIDALARYFPVGVPAEAAGR